MLTVVGKRIKRDDSYDKVRGKALFLDDIEFPGMLFGGVVRTTIPYGRVVKVNTDEINSMPGVVKVIDHTMIPGEKKHGVVLKDQPFLVDGVFKRAGDPIAIVVAEDKTALKNALACAKVEYEEYKGVFTIDDALKEDAPILGEKNNILYDLKVKKGNIDEGFKDAQYIAENWYHTPHVDHAFMQPEGAIARYDEEGNMQVYVTTQYPHYDREEIARLLNMPQDKVRMMNASVGGAFGAREDVSVQPQAALAAFCTKKPVKIVYSREESTTVHTKRHAFKMYYKTGVTSDGKLCALKARIWGDTGAYCSWGMNVLRKAAIHATGPYEIPNVDIESFAVYTNNSFSGAMRGFGASQPAIAYESQMDILAHMLHMDPLKFRYINAFSEGDSTATGQCLKSSVGIKGCIEEMAMINNIEL